MNEKNSGEIPAENRCERNDGKGWRCKKPKAKGEKMCLYRLPKNKKDLSPEADEGEVQLKEYLPIQSKGKVPRKRKGWKPAVKDSIGDGEDKEYVGVDGIEDEESDGEEEEGKGLMRQRGRKKWKGQNSLAKNATEDDKKEENAGTDDEEEDEEEEKKRKQRGQKMSRRKKEVEKGTPGVCENGAEKEEEHVATGKPKLRGPIHDENGIKIDSNMCHQCQRNDKGRVVRCIKCKTKRFCIPCIYNWYPQLKEEDIAQACPVCHGNCNCKACLRMEGSIILNEGFKLSEEEKIEHSKNLLRSILPFLKEFNDEQMIEKEMEAKIQGQYFDTYC